MSDQSASTPPPGYGQQPNPGDAVRDVRAGRAHRIRTRVILAAIVLSVAIWGAIFVKLVNGDDPVIGATVKNASNATPASQSNQSESGEGDDDSDDDGLLSGMFSDDDGESGDEDGGYTDDYGYEQAPRTPAPEPLTSRSS